MNTDTRYPYTYACDQIRQVAGYANGSTKLSRSDASQIMKEIGVAMGFYGYEQIAVSLANKHLKEQEAGAV
jgi:hypothetical protein